MHLIEFLMAYLLLNLPYTFVFETPETWGKNDKYCELGQIPPDCWTSEINHKPIPNSYVNFFASLQKKPARLYFVLFCKFV